MAARADPALDLHRGVTLRGRWITPQTVFLDNRQMNSKPGLYVVTPMKLEGSAAVVLVQRGWVDEILLIGHACHCFKRRPVCLKFRAALPRRQPSYMSSVALTAGSSGKISMSFGSVLSWACRCWQFLCSRPVLPVRVCCVSGRLLAPA